MYPHRSGRNLAVGAPSGQRRASTDQHTSPVRCLLREKAPWGMYFASRVYSWYRQEGGIWIYSLSECRICLCHGTRTLVSCRCWIPCALHYPLSWIHSNPGIPGTEEVAAAFLNCNAQIAHLTLLSHLGASYPTWQDSRDTSLVVVVEGRDGAGLREQFLRRNLGGGRAALHV